MADLISITKKYLPEPRYELASDVKMRLYDTYLKYDEDVCYVSKVLITPTDLEGLHIELFRLKDGLRFVCHSSDVLLDVSSLPLGWVGGSDKYPLFLSRTTSSSQKQGVCLHNVSVYSPSNSRFYRGYTGNESNRKFLLDMFEDRIQSISKTVRPEEGLGGPLNREWALINLSTKPGYFTIFQNTIQVGTYIEKTKTFFFRKGRLTKTRKNQLQEIFYHPLNAGERYAISEQA